MAKDSCVPEGSTLMRVLGGLAVLTIATAGLAQQEAAEEPAAAADEPSTAIGESTLEIDPADGQPQQSTPTDPVSRFEAELLLQERVEAEDFAAAAALAEQLLSLTAQEFGAESEQLAAARIRIAAVQSRNGEYVLAEENALVAIESLRQSSGIYSPQLIDPYMVLGDNYYASGDSPSAISAYTEARTISRRVYGLLNEGQIPIIDRMSDVAENSYQFVEAQSLQLEALTLIERSYEPQSREVLDAIYRYALWLRDSRLFTDEREQYRRADRIIREQYGDQSLERVKLLRLRANSFRTQGSQESMGIRGLREALEIVAAYDEPLIHAEVLRDLGDWDVAFSALGSDGDTYLQAWDMLADVENGEALRAEWFEPPTIVLLVNLDMRAISNNPEDPWGNVVLRFTVDTSGRTRDIEIVESNPPNLRTDAFARQARLSRYRPLVRDRRLVPARRAFDIDFRYVASSID